MKNLRDCCNINLMEIMIDDNMKLSEFSEKFHSRFPFLKVEIITLCGKYASATEGGLVRYMNRILGECRKDGQDEVIVIRGDIPVQALEEKFSRVYGLAVQVLRKSGKIWLETRLTSGWSLDEQNRQGESLSKSA